MSAPRAQQTADEKKTSKERTVTASFMSLFSTRPGFTDDFMDENDKASAVHEARRRAFVAGNVTRFAAEQTAQIIVLANMVVTAYLLELTAGKNHVTCHYSLQCGTVWNWAMQIVSRFSNKKRNSFPIERKESAQKGKKRQREPRRDKDEDNPRQKRPKTGRQPAPAPATHAALVQQQEAKDRAAATELHIREQLQRVWTDTVLPRLPRDSTFLCAMASAR
jgi:hypothetical protein